MRNHTDSHGIPVLKTRPVHVHDTDVQTI